MKAQVVSDGKSVWVNAPTGECIARFGRMGVDVHRSMAQQMSGGVECLACTHGPVSFADWQLFVAATKDHHGVDIAEKHRPKYLSESFCGPSGVG